MLFQTDEIDGMLQSINKSQDARHEGIMGALLTFYTSADSVVPMRRKAGQTNPGVIDQPCLVVFGTAIPNHYYEALSRRMLTNGFFARMIVVEGGARHLDREIGVAAVAGLGNARTILEQIRAGRRDLQFIEVMTCAGGCVAGGGQPRSASPDAVRARMQALYLIDRDATVRASHENPAIQRLYAEFLEKPLSHRSHELLHTRYDVREPVM